MSNIIEKLTNLIMEKLVDSNNDLRCRLSMDCTSQLETYLINRIENRLGLVGNVMIANEQFSVQKDTVFVQVNTNLSGDFHRYFKIEVHIKGFAPINFHYNVNEELQETEYEF
jgi:hypothetical protein